MTCAVCSTVNAEANLYAETIANMSAALLGVLQPGQPYEGNATSVSEAMRLHRAMVILARDLCLEKAKGRYDVDEKDVAEEIKRVAAAAAAEIQIIYESPSTLPAAFRPGKEPNG